jgi:hypothetical protein
MSSALELVPAISPPLVKTLRQYAVPSTYGDYEMTPGLNCLIVDAISYVRFMTDTSVTVNDYLQIEPFVPFLINVTSAAPVLEILRDSVGASPNLSFYPVAGSAPQVPWVPMQGPEYVVPYSVGTTATTYDHRHCRGAGRVGCAGGSGIRRRWRRHDSTHAVSGLPV